MDLTQVDMSVGPSAECNIARKNLRCHCCHHLSSTTTLVIDDSTVGGRIIVAWEHRGPAEYFNAPFDKKGNKDLMTSISLRRILYYLRQKKKRNALKES